MNYITTALGLVPLLVRLFEIIHGARKGEVKRASVVDAFFRLNAVLGRFAGVSLPDTPETRELVGNVVDEVVGIFNQNGVLPKPAAS